jgi:hypothetical protein
MGASPTNARRRSKEFAERDDYDNQESTPHHSERKECKEDPWERALEVARAYNVPVDVVHEKLLEFNGFDKTGSGQLSLEEFEGAVRQACHIPPGVEVPQHLLDRCWATVDADKDGTVSFEEYVDWSSRNAYCEEVLVPDAKQREMRRLAREHGFVITDVRESETSLTALMMTKVATLMKANSVKCYWYS